MAEKKGGELAVEAFGGTTLSTRYYYYPYVGDLPFGAIVPLLALVYSY